MSKKTVLRSEMGAVLLEAAHFDEAGELVGTDYLVKVPGVPSIETFDKESSAHNYFDDVVERLKVAEGNQFALR